MVPGKISVANGATNKTAQLVVNLNLEEWNPRLTAFNLYRATGVNVDNPKGLTYYLIKAISTLTLASEPTSNISLSYMRRTFAHGASDYDTNVAYTGMFASDVGVKGRYTTDPVWGNKADILLTGVYGDQTGPLTTDTEFNKDNRTMSLLLWKGAENQTQRWMWQYCSGGTSGTGNGGSHGHNSGRRLRSRCSWSNGSISNTSEQQRRNAGIHFRAIGSVSSGEVIKTLEVFRNTSPTPQYDVVTPTSTRPDRKYANIGWTSGSSSEYYHAVLDSDNLLQWAPHPNQAENLGIAKYCEDRADGHAGDHWCFGEASDYYSHDGTQWQGFSKIMIARKNYRSSSEIFSRAFISWKYVTLEANTWYYLTVNAQNTQEKDHGSTPKAQRFPGIEIGTWGQWSSPGDHDDESKLKFRMYVDVKPMGKDQWCTIGGWYYNVSAGSYRVNVGNMKDSPNNSSNGVRANRNEQLRLHCPAMFKCKVGPTSTAYFGSNTTYIPQDLGSGTSLEPGDIISLGGSSNKVIEETIEIDDKEIIKLNTEITDMNINQAVVHSQYTMTTETGADGTPLGIEVTLNDNGITDGEAHANQDASIATRYKTAKMMNGRLFVADVMLKPDEEREIHPNWIMFSELGKPDIIPIINYIAVMDIGEGKIHKLEELAGNLIAFSQNSIHRLNIPSYDPMQWSLMETVKNIGCTAIDGTLSILGTLFFCSKDNLYMMDSNFIPQPITKSIEDIYQNNYSDKIKIYHDSLTNILYIIFESKELYGLNLNRMPGEDVWQRYCFVNTFTSENNPQLMAQDEEFKSYIFYGDKMATLNVDDDANPESHQLLKSTGWMTLSLTDKAIMTTKFHMRYKSDVDIKVLFHTDFNSKSDLEEQKDKHLFYDEDSVIPKATSKFSASEGIVDEDKALIIPANCTSDGTLLTSSTKLYYTGRLGIRCHSIKLTIKTEDQSRFCEIYGVDLEHE